MALDLYRWITYKLATHRGFTRLTWQQLKNQLGTSYPDTKQGIRDFRKNARKALEEVKRVWPEADVTDWGNGLELRGTDPAVPKKRAEDRLRQLRQDDPGF